MATVKTKLRLSTVAGRPSSIIYQITHRRIVRQITTDYKVFPEDCKTGVSMIISVNDEAMGRLRVPRIISQKIRWDLERLNMIISKYENGHCEYSADMIVDAFQCMEKELSFFNIMQKSIIRLLQQNRIGTAKNYSAALGSFRDFRCNEDIPIDAIDYAVMEDYQSYLRMKGLALNSISFYMRILRAVYNHSVESGIISDRKPFRHVFTGMEKTFKRAISIKNIRFIKDLDLSFKPNLEFARDMFMFLFYCRGMSFIDAAFLKKSDVVDNVLFYRRHKTGQQLRIRMVPVIKDILERYSDNQSPYLLPIITVSGKDGRIQYEAALRRINNGLRTIAKMLGMDTPLTTYVTRHAWASIAKAKNIPITVISDALGHDSIATTQIYLASIDATMIDKANEMIINDL